MRLKCSNNLRQMALAMHDFASANNGAVPPAIGPAPPGAGDGTIFFHLLPYVDQDKLYAKGLDDAGVPSPWGGNVYSTPVAVYLCPADFSGTPDHRYQGWLATSSYAANYLVFRPPGTIVSSMPDGTSNTIIFTERFQICDDQPCAWAYSGETEWAPFFAYSSYEKFQLAPTKKQCNPALPQSVHAGGIVVAMGDGSVRLVSAGLNPLTWYYATCPDDGNPLGSDWEP
jgi:hypothetical protein